MRALLLATIPATLINASPSWAQNPPTRKPGAPQAEFAEPFSEIGAIRELRDGRVIVVDSRELTVKLLDFRTGTATTIGRSGDGPGEYRWPGRLYPLSGDSTLLLDAGSGRMMIIGPDGKPGGFFDPNRTESDSGMARMRRFNTRASDGRRYLYGEAQPIRIGANGTPELADHHAIERLDISSRKRDTVAMWPARKDANARIVGGIVATRPRMTPWPAWEHWLVAPNGRITFVFYEPYRVDFVENGRVIQNKPIPYERVKVDDALKKQYREEQERPVMVMRYSRDGGSRMEAIRRPFNPPAEWPEYLPPYNGNSVFAPDGLLWIPRLTAAGRPPLYDIISGKGTLVERVELPPRTKLIGFGTNTVYIARFDADDLQYLQRHPLPTKERP